MAWRDIFFGFRGRINRKYYWFASAIVTLAGLALVALLSYLVTGNAASAGIWQRGAGNAALWLPVWGAYLLLMAWPLAAVAIKRLHDRGRPAWLWYVYYGATSVLTLLPVRSAAGAQADPAAGAATIVLLIFGAYIMFELGALRGAAGPNALGTDPMPAGYCGGDYSFWSWMLAWEGRLGRAKWWLGIAIVMGTVLTGFLAISLIVNVFAGRHPEIEQALADPRWVNSKDANALLFELGLWTMAPVLAILLAIWSMIALGVKRLHDRNLSSWLILVVILPLLGALSAPALAEGLGLAEGFTSFALLLLLASAIWSVLQFGILKGASGPNEHGPDQLAEQG